MTTVQFAIIIVAAFGGTMAWLLFDQIPNCPVCLKYGFSTLIVLVIYTMGPTVIHI